MAKLTREQKIEIYNRKMNGETHSNLSEIYGINRSVIKYLVRLIDLHGSIILRNDSNRYYSPDFKLVSINRVLVNHESVNSVALDIGLSSAGMLRNWIRKYKENGYNVIEKKQGRPSMTKPKISKNQKLTSEEEIKELKKRLQYVEAENEYLKKLKVIVDQRVEREKKK
jgi:transposase